MDGGENKSGTYKTQSLGRFFKLLLSLIAIIGFTSVVLAIVAVETYSNKSLPNSTVASTDLSGLNLGETNQRLAVLVQELESKKINLSGSETNLKELSINVDENFLRDQIILKSNLSYVDKVKNIFASIAGKSKNAEIRLISSNDSIEKIQSIIDNNKTQPKNAYFAISNNALTIVPDIKGKQVNPNKTIDNIALALNSNTSMVEVYYEELNANIALSDLEQVFGQLNSIVAKELNLLYGNKVWTLSSADLLKWINVSKNNAIAVSVNEEAIRTSINKVSSEIELASQKQIKDSKGNIIQQGKKGLSLNKTKAINDIKQLINDRKNYINNNQISLAVEETGFQTATVYPNSTAGLYEGKYIDVDLSSQTLYQYEGEKLIASYKISSGKSSTPTPVGTFRINSKNLRAWSSSAKLWMPYWMAFIGSKYGLHELPEWPGGYKEGQNHLGMPVSHGCIRLGVGSAQKIYSWADVGTPVVIHH